MPDAISSSCASTWKTTVILIFTLLVVGIGSLPADINPSGKQKSPALLAPPSPLAKVARVVRGNVTELELQATSGSLARVLFVIREQPAHGTLEGPFPINGQPTRVMIRYISNGTAGVDEDTFSFAAQLRGGPLSKTVRVNLILVDAVAELEFAPEIAFSEVRMGRQVSKKLKITNTGNAPFFTNLTLEAPWSIPPDSAKLSLKEGESTEVPILFLPTTVGQHKGELVLDAELGLNVRLSGAGSPVFTADPSKLDFLNGEGSQRITLKSHSPFDEEITLISEGGQMLVPDRLMLPAGGEVGFDLSLPEGSGAGFRSVLHIRQHQQTTLVEVASGGSPANIVLEDIDGGLLQMGRSHRGAPMSSTIRLTNKGGLPAFFTMKTETPFWIPEASEGLKVEAGETREVAIEVDTSAPGSYSSLMLAEYEGGGFSVKLTALVIPDAKAPMQHRKVSDWVYTPAGGGTVSGAGAATVEDDSRTLANLSDEARRHHAMEAIVGSTMLTRESTDLVPPVTEVVLKHAGENRLLFGWKRPPDGSVKGYLIEFSEVVYDAEARLLRTRWVPQKKNIEITEDGPVQFLATVSALQPNTIRKLRVTAIGFDDLASIPSPEYTFRTLPPTDRSFLVWGALVLLLLILTVWFFLRKRMTGAGHPQ